MKKFLAKAAITIICLPLILVLIFIILSMVFMGINRSAAEKQTKNAADAMSGAGMGIIDTVTFSGNSSGTGNHVDMLSLIAVRTESPSALEKYCDKIYTPEEFERSFSFPSGTKSVEIPDDNDNCYIAMICKPAPFPDNIEGH